MKSLLSESFGGDFREDVSLLYHKFPYSQAEVRAIVEGNPMVRCIAGHRFSALMPNVPEVSLVVITQLRDPAERFLSHYFFFRQHRGQNFWPEVNTLSLTEYFEWAIVDGNAPEMANYQTWFLTGHANEDGLMLAEQRIRNGQLLAFPLSRFDEALVWLSKSQPERFSDCSYARKNVRFRAGEEDHQQEALQISDLIKEYDQFDCKLIELADCQLNDLLSNSFESSEDVELELEQLRRRNASVEKRERRKRRLARIADKLRG